MLILLIMCLKKLSRRFCFGHIIYRIYRIGGLSRAEGAEEVWRILPPAKIRYISTGQWLNYAKRLAER